MRRLPMVRTKARRNANFDTNAINKNREAKLNALKKKRKGTYLKPECSVPGIFWDKGKTQ